jgi:hypothetical protein
VLNPALDPSRRFVGDTSIRHVVDTITSKAVLILGRFTDERKAVLDALRQELRKRDYLPILFDFAVPATRDMTETIFATGPHGPLHHCRPD